MTDCENEGIGGLERALVASPADIEVRVLMKKTHEDKVQTTDDFYKVILYVYNTTFVVGVILWKFLPTSVTALTVTVT